MKKQLLVLLTAAAMIMTGCNSSDTPAGDNSSAGGDSGESSQSSHNPALDDTEWADDVAAEMMTYLGEYLPFVQLDDATLEFGYSDLVGAFFIYDESETDLFASVDYVAKLEEFGYTEGKDAYDDTVYTKTVLSKNHAELYFGWEEATDYYAAGNTITVYLNPVVDEDYLLEAGYEKQTGWPTDLVAATLEGSGVTLEGVNLQGEWYVAADIDVDEEYGEYYLMLYLATAGSYGEAMAEKCVAAGLEYDEEYNCYYEDVYYSEVDISEQDGFTFVSVFGPTLEYTPEEGEVTNEVTNDDGSISVTFTFADVLVDQTTYDGREFESTSAKLTVHQGEASTAPTYYSNGETLRFYAKNTMDIEAATGLEIKSVEITVSTTKKLNGVASDYTVNHGSVAVDDNKVATISGVNFASLEVGIGMSASSGNLGVSKIVVTVK